MVLHSHHTTLRLLTHVDAKDPVMMQDFSQYQGPSEEWEAFVKANPLPAPNMSLSPKALRTATNALRVKISQAELERDG